MDEDSRVIYQQDCESFRYQDRLFWSRFQTLVVIEGAAIGVILTKTIKGCPAIILAFGTFLLVGLISVLAIKDRRDSKNFIARMWKYEKDKTDEIIPQRGFKIGCLSFPFDSLIFTVIVSILLALLNVYLIVFTFLS